MSTTYIIMHILCTTVDLSKFGPLTVSNQGILMTQKFLFCSKYWQQQIRYQHNIYAALFVLKIISINILSTSYFRSLYIYLERKLSPGEVS